LEVSERAWVNNCVSVVVVALIVVRNLLGEHEEVSSYAILSVNTLSTFLRRVADSSMKDVKLC
jgi:hypothetical protein